MNDMKHFARRAMAVHRHVASLVLVLTGALNYLVWTYAPDAKFDTLETLLLPFARPVVSVGTIAIAVSTIFDRHTVRVLRKLASRAR